jgi:hypothetical protein
MNAVIAGLVAMLVLVIATMIGELRNNEAVAIPPMPTYAPAISESAEWDEYHADAVAEYADEFTALFNSYEVKRAKNGALMIRRGNSGSFKFARKG